MAFVDTFDYEIESLDQIRSIKQNLTTIRIISDDDFNFLVQVQIDDL